MNFRGPIKNAYYIHIIYIFKMYFKISIVSLQTLHFSISVTLLWLNGRNFLGFIRFSFCHFDIIDNSSIYNLSVIYD